MKKYSKSIIIKEIQIKAMTKYYLTSVRRVIARDINNKC
jgi:hypothetical protein